MTDLTKLTPGETTYGRELELARLGPAESLAAWIESDGAGDRVCRRTVYDGEPGDIMRVRLVAGAPSQPRIAGDRLVWTEYEDGRGTVCSMRLGGRAEVVEPLAAVNCGGLAAVADDAGCHLLVEQWQPRGVLLRLLSCADDVWHDRGLLPLRMRFHCRPGLALRGERLIACWDAYSGGAYRSYVGLHSGDRWRIASLPHKSDCRDTLTTVLAAPDGHIYAARTRDRCVELPPGLCAFHSKLVVSVSKDGEDWQDIAQVTIDDAMNPWLAAYVGHRRFPKLVPAEQGAWLLWEEKIEAGAMHPSLGRLCGLRIRAHEPAEPPRVLLDGHCMFEIEDGANESDVLVASRTQMSHRAQRLPYYLHRIDLTREHPLRPVDLTSNASAPTFDVTTPPRPRPTLEGGKLQLLFGDPHLHSRLSGDLEGEQDELYYFARDVARLDFCAVTENDFHWLVEPLSEADWERSRRNAAFFNEPGIFTVLLGWEYTRHRGLFEGDSLDSHRSVIYPGGEGEVHTWHEGRTPTPEALVQKLKDRRVLLHHHHPNGFDISDDSVERNIEVVSGWWNCMERGEFVRELHRLLGNGLRLGFIGASDNHERNPGLGGALTGVWAEENTREAIFNAFWNRRVFATTGCRPDLRVRVAGAFMGAWTEVDERPVVEVDVRGESPVRRIEIIRDGDVIHACDEDAQHVRWAWRDEACTAGRHYYYVHVVFQGQEANPYWNIATAYGVQAWSSPVWVTLTEKQGASP